MKQYTQGIYKPLFESKYVGNVNNIIYRSGLELNFFEFVDKNRNIQKWGSEEIVIPYFYDIDRKIHNYFPDLFIEYINKDKKKEKAIIELKSSNEYAASIIIYMKNTKKNLSDTLRIFQLDVNKDKSLITAIMKYKLPTTITRKKAEWINQLIKNLNKWKYAKKFCKDNNIKFIILTELDLNFI
jgi:hypothetical protein